MLLASPIAATVDVEKLLWVPKPIITVPAMPWTYGGITRPQYAFWRNGPVALYGGGVGGGKTNAFHDAIERTLLIQKRLLAKQIDREMFSDGQDIKGLQLIVAGEGGGEFGDDDDPDY